MLHCSADKIGYGLYSAMWMPGKSLYIILRIGGVKTVKHQKRVKVHHRLLSQYPAQMYTCPVNSLSSSHNPCHFSFFHIVVILILIVFQSMQEWFVEYNYPEADFLRNI